MLTASRFGSCVGLGYNSRHKEWRLATGRDVFEGNVYTQHGNESEKYGLEFAERITEIKYENTLDNQKFFIHREYGFLGCTPDGIHKDTSRIILEIKCPYNPPLVEYTLRQKCVKYLPQIQGQLEICDADYAYLAVYHEEVSHIYRIERSKQYWDWMYPHLEEFWAYVEEDIEPSRRHKVDRPFGDFIDLLQPLHEERKNNG